MENKMIKKMPVSDLNQGLFETAATPRGNYRTSWIMQLRRTPNKCQLPRGFGNLSGKRI